tara:strand:- start:7625 stop:8215 length:591 start_codon:yes stop_codon:yes gene_type:complete
MKKTKVMIKTPDGEFENNLIFFDKSDKPMLKKMFNCWVDLCELSIKAGGTRTINLPETLSEAIFSIDMNVGRCVEGISGSSSSFDHYDHKNHKRIQLKAASSYGPSSFGPRSEYDDIYFFFFREMADSKKRRERVFDGSYEIYKLDTNLIPDIMVNRSETVKDQQRKGKRPRFIIPEQMIKPFNLKPIKKGNIEKW